MSMREHSEDGFALVTALSFLVIVGVLVATSMLLGLANRTRSSDTLLTTQAQVAAEAGMDEAYRQAVLDVFEGLPDESRTLTVYRQKLLGKTFTVNLASGSANTFALDTTTPFLDTSLSGASYSRSGVVNFKSTVGGAGALTAFDVKVQRIENPSADQAVIYVRSVGTVTNASGERSRRVLEQYIYIKAPVIAPDFAVLSNNLNCTFCHTKVATMAAAYGGSAAGTDRARVGTLETLEVRFKDSGPDSTDTLIGGTLYTRGKFVDQSRVDITQSRLSGGIQDIQTYNTNPATGKIADTTRKSLNVQDCNVASQCTSQNNFYLNYPQGDSATKLDGNLPTNFPPPVKLANPLARVITTSDWTSDIARTSAKEGAYGSIGVNPGGTMQLFDNSGNPKVITNPASSGANGIDGNLYIKGDINLDKTVYVNGDVMITGRVLGKGKIVTRGNIYVTGDLQYRCTASTTCSNTDYANPTTLPSSLGLLAGGNIIMGDYLTGRSDGDTTGRHLNVNSVANWTDGSYSFVLSEITNFNKLEYDKAQKNSAYVPRFYKFRSTDTKFYAYSGSGEGANNVGDTTKLDALNPLGNGRAFVVASLDPTSAWRTDKSVKQEWINNVELDTTRPANTPLRIDAALYSGNAIFGLVRGSSNNGGTQRSVTNGQMVVNGAIISPDMGLLAAGSGGKKRKSVADELAGKDTYGLKVHYDPRAKDLLSVENPAQVARSYYKLVKSS